MIRKSKTVWHVTLSEAKQHLRLDADFIQDNAYILGLIKTAHSIAEDEIQKDIAKTTNVLTLYDFAGDSIRVNEGNLLSITTIEIKESADPLTNFTTFAFRDGFRVDLDNAINTEELTVTFETGYAPITEEDPDAIEIPPSIKHAILIKIADLYDIDRASSITGGLQRTGIFETLLAPYKAQFVTIEREN